MSIELAPNDDHVPYDAEFFELLWKVHARVHITDTIVYKYGKMESWFFNKRRKSVNLDVRAEPPKVCKKRDYTVRRGDLNQTIMEAFTSHCVNDSELVATWVSGEPDALCRVLHLTKATLHQFLAYLPDKGHGLLQRWTAPFGGRNSLLRTEWSPHHFSLELCSNWKAVSANDAPADSPLNSRFVRAMRESVASRRRGAYHAGSTRTHRCTPTRAHAHERSWT